MAVKLVTGNWNW